MTATPADVADMLAELRELAAYEFAPETQQIPARLIGKLIRLLMPTLDYALAQPQPAPARVPPAQAFQEMRDALPEDHEMSGYHATLVRFARGEATREEVRAADPLRESIAEAARLAAESYSPSPQPAPDALREALEQMTYWLSRRQFVGNPIALSEARRLVQQARAALGEGEK